MELNRVIDYERVLNTNLKSHNQLFSVKLNSKEYLTLIEYLLNLPIEKIEQSVDYYAPLKNCYKLIYFTMIRWSSLPLEYMVFKGPSVTLLISFINSFIQCNFDSVQLAIDNFLLNYPNLTLEFKDYGLELSEYNWRIIKKVEKSNSSKNLEEVAELIVAFTEQQAQTLTNLELVNNQIYTEFNLNNEELIDSLIYYYDILTKLISKNLFKVELIRTKYRLLGAIHTTFDLKYFNPILSGVSAEDSQSSYVFIDRLIDWLCQFPTSPNSLIGKDSSIFCDLEYYYTWSNKFKFIKDKLANHSYYSKCEFIVETLVLNMRSAYQPYKDSQTHTETITNNSATLTPPAQESSESNSDLLTAEQESLITQIKDLFPELGEGYIQVCLREFEYDLELTIMSILEDNLPNHINELDKSMTKIK